MCWVLTSKAGRRGTKLENDEMIAGLFRAARTLYGLCRGDTSAALHMLYSLVYR